VTHFQPGFKYINILEEVSSLPPVRRLTTFARDAFPRVISIRAMEPAMEQKMLRRSFANAA